MHQPNALNAATVTVAARMPAAESLSPDNASDTDRRTDPHGDLRRDTSVCLVSEHNDTMGPSQSRHARASDPHL